MILVNEAVSGLSSIYEYVLSGNLNFFPDKSERTAIHSPLCPPPLTPDFHLLCSVASKKKCFIYLISLKACSIILRGFSVPKPLIYALSPFTLLRRPWKHCHFNSQGHPKSLAKNMQIFHTCACSALTHFCPLCFLPSVPSTLVLSYFWNSKSSHLLFYSLAFMHYFHFCNGLFSFPFNTCEGLKKFR